MTNFFRQMTAFSQSNSSSLSHRTRLTFIVFLLFFLLLPSLRVFYKYLPYPSVLTIVWFSLMLFLMLRLMRGAHPRLQSYLANPYFIASSLFLLAVLVWVIYPMADGLKTQMRGSDQDDCVILGALQLLEFKYPYTVRSYFNNPCSTGPGILLLYLPFVWLKAYALGAVAVLVTVCFCLRKVSTSWLPVGLFLFLLVSSFAIDELLVVGSDLVALSLGLTILALTIPSAVAQKSLSALLVLALLCGLLSASRLNFLILFPFLSLLIFWHWKKGGLVFFCFALVSSLGPALLLYLTDSAHFTPLHLASKAGGLLSPLMMGLAAFICLILGLIALGLGKKNLTTLPLSLFLFLTPMLFFLALADWMNRGWSFAQWEGANYLIPVIPLVALILTQGVLGRQAYRR